MMLQHQETISRIEAGQHLSSLVFIGLVDNIKVIFGEVSL